MAQALIRISLEIRTLCTEDWKFDAHEFHSSLLHFAFILGLQIYLCIYHLENAHHSDFPEVLGGLF